MGVTCTTSYCRSGGGLCSCSDTDMRFVCTHSTMNTHAVVVHRDTSLAAYAVVRITSCDGACHAPPDVSSTQVHSADYAYFVRQCFCVSCCVVCIRVTQRCFFLIRYYTVQCV